MESFAQTTEWIPGCTKWITRSNAPQLFEIGGAVVDRQSGKVFSARGERWLRGKELDLLAHLYSHIGVTFTRSELLESVWHCCPNLLTRTVDQTVATLRRKIEIDPQHPRFLRTIYGVGYSLSVNKGTK